MMWPKGGPRFRRERERDGSVMWPKGGPRFRREREGHGSEMGAQRGGAAARTPADALPCARTRELWQAPLFPGHGRTRQSQLAVVVQAKCEHMAIGSGGECGVGAAVDVHDFAAHAPAQGQDKHSVRRVQLRGNAGPWLENGDAGQE